MPRPNKWGSFQGIALTQQLNRIKKLLDVNASVQGVFSLYPFFEEQPTNYEVNYIYVTLRMVGFAKFFYYPFRHFIGVRHQSFN